MDVVERERPSKPAMALGIQTHVAGLSLPNIVRLLEDLGVQRFRKAVHDWVQKADPQPESGQSPNQIALDETMIRVNDQQYWLYTVTRIRRLLVGERDTPCLVNAADPDTNKLLPVCLISTTTTTLPDIFLRELRQKHDVETTVFLVDGAQHLQTALYRAGLRFQMRRHGHRNAIERSFRELKRRTSSFSTCFSHVDPETSESWLQTFARWHNAPN